MNSFKLPQPMLRGFFIYIVSSANAFHSPLFSPSSTSSLGSSALVFVNTPILAQLSLNIVTPFKPFFQA